MEVTTRLSLVLLYFLFSHISLRAWIPGAQRTNERTNGQMYPKQSNLHNHYYIEKEEIDYTFFFFLAIRAFRIL